MVEFSFPVKGSPKNDLKLSVKKCKVLFERTLRNGKYPFPGNPIFLELFYILTSFSQGKRHCTALGDMPGTKDAGIQGCEKKDQI